MPKLVGWIILFVILVLVASAANNTNGTQEQVGTPQEGYTTHNCMNSVTFTTVTKEPGVVQVSFACHYNKQVIAEQVFTGPDNGEFKNALENARYNKSGDLNIVTNNQGYIVQMYSPSPFGVGLYFFWNTLQK